MNNPNTFSPKIGELDIPIFKILEPKISRLKVSDYNSDQKRAILSQRLD